MNDNPAGWVLVRGRVAFVGPYSQQLERTHHQWTQAEIDAQASLWRDPVLNARAELLARRYNTLALMAIKRTLQTITKETKDVGN